MTPPVKRVAALIAFVIAATGLAARARAAQPVVGSDLASRPTLSREAFSQDSQLRRQSRAADKSITGRWTVSAEGYTMEMTLTQDDREITGTLQSPHGPVAIRGVFDNVWLAFSGASNGEPHAIELSAKGILRADGTLAGVMTSNVGDFTWTAVRHDR